MYYKYDNCRFFGLAISLTVFDAYNGIAEATINTKHDINTSSHDINDVNHFDCHKNPHVIAADCQNFKFAKVDAFSPSNDAYNE